MQHKIIVVATHNANKQMTINTGIIMARFSSVEFVIIIVYVGFAVESVIVFVVFVAVSVGLVKFSIDFVEEYCVVATDSLMIKDDKFLIIPLIHFPLHSVQTSPFCNVYKQIIDNDRYIMHSVKRNVINKNRIRIKFHIHR